MHTHSKCVKNIIQPNRILLLSIDAFGSWPYTKTTVMPFKLALGFDIFSVISISLSLFISNSRSLALTAWCLMLNKSIRHPLFFFISHCDLFVFHSFVTFAVNQSISQKQTLPLCELWSDKWRQQRSKQIIKEVKIYLHILRIHIESCVYFVIFPRFCAFDSKPATINWINKPLGNVSAFTEQIFRIELLWKFYIHFFYTVIVFVFEFDKTDSILYMIYVNNINILD